MPKKKTSSKTIADQKKDPVVSRPLMPSAYGVPKDRDGLLPWSYVTERMEKAMQFWISTVTPAGRPHATPVEGLWLEDRLYFGGDPSTRWQRNLASNPALDVHLESPVEPLILRGDAVGLKGLPKSLTTALSEASVAKYGYSPGPEAYERAGVYVFRPRVVIAWRRFPKDATRWQFRDAD